MGNPLAFEEPTSTRKRSAASCRSSPSSCGLTNRRKTRTWCQAIAPAYLAHQVLDEAQPFDQNVAESLWRCTGRVRYARKRIDEIQMSILKRRVSELSTATMETHYRELASFGRLRSIIEGLVRKDGELISAHDDIPVERFKERWKRCAEQVASEGEQHLSGRGSNLKSARATLNGGPTFAQASNETRKLQPLGKRTRIKKTKIFKIRRTRETCAMAIQQKPR